MTTSQPCSRVLILSAGAFGDAVTSRLTQLYPTDVQDVGQGTHPSLWPYADMIVLATSSERPQLAELVDQVSFVRRVPWLAVFATATEIQCGPLVVPGRTACHRCFVRRRNQHAPTKRDVRADDARHPTGHPDHHVGIATAFVRQSVDEAFHQSPAEVGGTVRRFDQASGATSRAFVVAVNRCPRCRPQRPPADELWHAIERGAREESNV